MYTYKHKIIVRYIIYTLGAIPCNNDDDDDDLYASVWCLARGLVLRHPWITSA